MLLSVAAAYSKDAEVKPLIVDAAIQNARFADEVTVKLDLTGWILQTRGPGHIQPIRRQRLNGEAFQLSVAGPKPESLSFDQPLPWTACAKFNLGLPFEYLTSAPSESWAVRK